MKLYDNPLSPFTSRCRIQIYAKGLDVERVAPPGGASSAEYRALNPLGRIPALEVNGTVIPESQTICELLEDLHPQPALLPADPIARARVRLLCRFTDLYLFPIESALSNQFDPKTRDAAVVTQKLTELQANLELLESLLDKDDSFAVGSALTLADCALFPLFFFMTRLIPVLGGKNPLDGRPRLAAWWETVGKHPAVSRVNGEMEAALVEYLAQRR